MHKDYQKKQLEHTQIEFICLQDSIRHFYGIESQSECVIKTVSRHKPKKVQDILLDRLFIQGFFRIEHTLNVSHSICAYILQKLINLKEVGLYIFNDTLYEMLSAQQSIKYRKFLLKQFERFQIMKGGECKVLESLYSLLEYRLNQYAKQEIYYNSTGIIRVYGDGAKFVCVFSEFSTCVDEDLLEKIQRHTQREEINLVLFNIANSNRNHEQAKNLAQKMSACYVESEMETIRWISHLNQSSVPIHTQGYVEFL